jgi:hypothetical protein
MAGKRRKYPWTGVNSWTAFIRRKLSETRIVVTLYRSHNG